MNGLLLNNFYSMLSNIKLSFGIALALMFVPIVTKNSSIISMIMCVQVFIFVADTGTSLQIDERSKWNKFEITLPVKRSAIIKAKYASFILLIAIGAIISALTAVISVMVLDNVDVGSLIWGLCFGLTLSITTVAFVYPIILRIGAIKSELIMVLGVGFSMGIMFITPLLLSLFMEASRITAAVTGIAEAIVSVLLFIISYLISVQMHRNKEF